jgi:hemerythrin
MTLIDWTPALSVDISSVDAQHKKLLGYMNDLYDALNQRKELEILSRIFRELENYTKTHFVFEEEYFKKFNYKGAEAHILQHQMFINKIASMEKPMTEGLADVEDLLDYLVNWLTHHIKVTDHEYITCFHEHGLK